ncbi:MAG: type II toxin-antitoxin system PemK/MazF family toxin [Gemmatimonadetes bacterium]|nr:type II toxin-antitoxin system PemK/MazF family toxin [Gemmatimonadota bacterium]
MKDSAAVVTQVVTLDKDFLSERVGRIPTRLMAQVDAGLRLALDP